MAARVAQLRNAFGLDDSEELYGQFSCAHTRPRWGAQFLQGQLYVFSSVMVFHANLLAVIKVERIHFKDVQVIRKRSFMRMPNTIAVVRCDCCTGATRDDVFTSFLFTSRRKAFELMAARWRAVNPEAADAYLSSLGAGCGPGGSLLQGSSSGSLNGDLRRQGSAGGSDGSSGTCVGTCVGSVAGPLHFPAWHEVGGAAAERLLTVPEDMAEMAGAVLPGVSARTLAEVLLSDQSGFLPAVYKAQGNELVSLTPWQVSSGRHVSVAPHVQPPPGSLTRSLQYVYSTSGPWGAVRSLVVQEQLLLPAAGGRLVLLIAQRMPDLPAGAGKCFYMTVRWDISPAAAGTSAAATAPAADAAPATELSALEHPVSPHTPTAAVAAAAAAAASARAAPADVAQQQQRLAGAPAAMPRRSTPPAAAAAPPAFESTTDESSDDGYESDSSHQPLGSPSPLPGAAPSAGSSSKCRQAAAGACLHSPSRAASSRTVASSALRVYWHTCTVAS
ncbi:hypothetical protein COO60DRAFT_168881 [Scenedesmus sp. NREL 46B-D3]|nr:hypothetical protein COO60DRAFT_168881 [Scenedesmus sp. NREL 46B-D3]